MKKQEEEQTADVVLSDGSTARVRTLSDGDLGAIELFVKGLSDRTVALRFGAVADRNQLTKMLTPSASACSLAALRGPSIVGLATCERNEERKAEVGVVIADDFQGKGLRTILLGQLAQSASKKGIGLFEASVTPDNSAMIKMLHELGFPTSTKIEPGALRVEFPTSVELTTVEVFEKRESLSVVAALRNILEPRAVAVIGASKNRDSIGGRLFHNALEGGFNGPVYPVNPNSEIIQSVPAYKSVLDCPGKIDLGIVVVPAPLVLQVAKECAL